ACVAHYDQLPRAARAVQLVHVAVDLDHVLAARGAVQPVDVLGEHHDAGSGLRELRDDLVGAVGRRAPAGPLDLGDVLPAQLRTPRHHRAGQRLLDLDAV